MREYQIPEFLHKIHGIKNTLPEIFMPHIVAVLASIYTVLLMQDYGLLDTILLVIITYDLSGGAVANFTKGTSDYYSKSSRLRNVFLLTHLSQPLVLIYVFSNSTIEIVLLCLFLLVASVYVNQLKSLRHQTWIGITVVSVSVIFLFGAIPSLELFKPLHPALMMNLIFMSIKLPLSFSVRWWQNSN